MESAARMTLLVATLGKLCSGDGKEHDRPRILNEAVTADNVVPGARLSAFSAASLKMTTIQTQVGSDSRTINAQQILPRQEAARTLLHCEGLRTVHTGRTAERGFAPFSELTYRCSNKSGVNPRR